MNIREYLRKTFDGWYCDCEDCEKKLDIHVQEITALYSSELKKKIEKLRRHPPTTKLGGDIIVSHPGHEAMCTCSEENKVIDEVLKLLKDKQ